MGYCIQCGSPIPSGQQICSMCHGDPDYDKDEHSRRCQEEQRIGEEENELRHQRDEEDD